ncbi:unnamed protein product, partial [Rotaria sordida]
CGRTLKSPTYESLIDEFCHEKGYGNIQSK